MSISLPSILDWLFAQLSMLKMECHLSKKVTWAQLPILTTEIFRGHPEKMFYFDKCQLFSTQQAVMTYLTIIAPAIGAYHSAMLTWLRFSYHHEMRRIYIECSMNPWRKIPSRLSRLVIMRQLLMMFSPPVSST